MCPGAEQALTMIPLRGIFKAIIQTTSLIPPLNIASFFLTPVFRGFLFSSEPLFLGNVQKCLHGLT
jgi:hypothetical protein